MTDTPDNSVSEHYSVCGLIVLASPQCFSEVTQALVLMPGVDVHCSDQVSKLVLTIEDDQNPPSIPQQIDLIRDLSGVMDVSLAFSHTE
jgi:nitrate reductase NapAB chaperone NapD